MWSSTDPPGAGALTVFLITGLGLVSCATRQSFPELDIPEARMVSYLRDKPKPLHPMFRKLLRQDRRNQVLNNMRVGVAAMEIGAFDVAGRSLESALQGIETVYANNARARRARSLWYEEGMKDFKGEPYERAMAYYYRGLVYLDKGDLENARACFRNGVIQDSFAEEEQHRCDFALLFFLQGWASQCLGDREMARTAYGIVKQLRPDFSPPAAGDNTLVLVESGTAPRKLTDGVGHYKLVFRRGRNFTEERARALICGRTRRIFPMEDIAWQAATRGGRLVDAILRDKIKFKESSAGRGKAFSSLGNMGILLMPTNAGAGAAAAVSMLGVVQSLVAANAHPRADDRCWDNLPDLVHVTTCHTTPGDTITVEFTTRSGKPVPGLCRQVKVRSAGNRHRWAWTRSRSALSASS